MMDREHREVYNSFELLRLELERERRERRIANAATVAALLLIVVAMAAVMLVRPAQAEEVACDWTWKAAPSDRLNNAAAMGMMAADAMGEVGSFVAEAAGASRVLDGVGSVPEWREPEQVVEYAGYEQAYIGYASEYDNDLRSAGVVYDNGTRYTWYSQRVLPGGGLTELNSNGRTVNGDGFVTDGDGYIAVASQDPIGTVVDTPWGQAKVYDYCGTDGTVDIYTDF